MQTIRVDDEVFARIQQAAIPLVDDANSALRRLIGLPTIVASSNGTARKHQRTPRGHLTPHPVLRDVLYKVLIEKGGSAQRRDVLEEFGRILAGRFTQADLVTTQTGEMKWENRVSWERQNMVIEGLLRNDSPYGVWALSEKGYAEARSAAV